MIKKITKEILETLGVGFWALTGGMVILIPWIVGVVEIMHWIGND